MKNTTLTPQDYETIFHIVANKRDEREGDDFERLGDLLNKIGTYNVTGLGLLNHYYGGNKNNA